MADENQMIHGYADEISELDFRRTIYIDTDAQQEDGNWVSKRMLPEAIAWFVERSFNKAIMYAYHTTDQIATAPNLATLMKFGTIQLASNFTIAPNQSTITYIGDFTRICNVQFSAQISRATGGSSQTIDIWMRKNGTYVPNSNTSVNVVANSGYLVAAWNLCIDLNPNDFFELVWAVSSVDIQLKSEIANSLHPATPSTILSIQTMI